MAVKPITPQEASERFADLLPSYVIEAFNELIAEKIGTGKQCEFSQDEAVDRILEKAKEAGVKLEREEIFDRRYLDIEKKYEKAGWDVCYMAPGYDETYKGSFRFSCADTDD